MGRNTQKNLRHLSQRQQKTTKVKARFTEKIIHTFSNYALSEEEKQALSYSLDKHIPVKLNKTVREFLLQYYATHRTLETK